MEQTEKLLTNAAEEIKHLRAANREMGIRLEMFDHCMMLLNAAPQRQGMGLSGPDIVYDINKYLEEQKKMAFEKQQAREAEEKAEVEKIVKTIKSKSK